MIESRSKAKYILPSLVFALLAIVIGSALFYFLEYSNRLQILSVREQEHIRSISRIVRQQASQILIDLHDLGSHEPLQEFSRTHSEESRKAVIAGFSSFIRHNKKYDQIRFLNTDGMELIRINKGADGPIIVANEQLQDKSHRYYFKESISLAPGETYVSPFDLNIENKQIELPFKPMLRVATPFFDSQNALRGVLILNYLGDTLLQHLEMEGADSTQVELLNSEGYWLKSTQPELEWAFMFPDKKHLRFSTRFPSEWETIHSKLAAGQLETENGIFTYTVVSPFGSAEEDIAEHGRYHWHLVSHILPGEESAIRKELITQVLVVGLIVMVLAAPVCFLFAGYKQKGIRQIVLETANDELRRALEEIKTLRGTLPICASCKSIRDDEGYWNKIEKYISEHSEADFSHGLCPECMDNMYSGQEWYEKSKKTR